MRRQSCCSKQIAQLTRNWSISPCCCSFTENPGYTPGFYHEEKFTESVSFRYITSFYWALTTVTTVGYGDISATTWPEKAFAVLGMLTGGFVFGMIVASLSDIVRKSNPGDTMKAELLGGIHAYLHERQCPPGLTRRIRAYFSAHYTTKGTVLDEYDIFVQMPEHFREELALYLNYIDQSNGDDPKEDGEGTVGSFGLKAICHLPFFEGLCNLDVILVCSKLKYERIHQAELDQDGKPDYYVMQENDREATEMFVVLEGSIRIEQGGHLLGKLGPGGYFGELAVMLPWLGNRYKRVRSAYSLEKTMLAVLSSNDMFELRRESPSIDSKVAEYVEAISAHKPSMLLGVGGEPVGEVEKVVSEHNRLSRLEEKMTSLLEGISGQLTDVTARLERLEQR